MVELGLFMDGGKESSKIMPKCWVIWVISVKSGFTDGGLQCPSFWAEAVTFYVLSTLATRDSSFHVCVMSNLCIVPMSV